MAFAGMASSSAARGSAEVDMTRVIADAVGAARHEGRERGVEVVVHAPSSLPAVVGDADALRSALQNVVGNAVKYSPNDARVDLTASVEGGRLRIVVTDRGLGIDAGDLPQIFKPFFRGRRAADAQIRGAGIGLAVVRHAIDAHRGTIRVASRVGEGTTVTIELPAEERAGEPAARRAAEDASA
jgi:signal transduction histidine kinase